ncbi:MAG: hypothetical protein Q8N63_01850 [Nanoarchaeota archaeon]|nr:hypothetical protein [Nanoarchaeota archaeon]
MSYYNETFKAKPIGYKGISPIESFLQEKGLTSFNINSRALSIYHNAEGVVLLRYNPAAKALIVHCQQIYKTFLDDLVEAFPDLKSKNDRKKVQSRIIHSQSYEGRIRSVSKKKIIVEFDIDGDIEERVFDPKDLLIHQQLKEEQVVLARCVLEIVPPRGPLSDKEIEKFKQKYKSCRDYHKKSKKSNSLLDD